VSRTAARVDVIAPDGREYVVRAVRVWWPRESPVLDATGDLLPGPVGTVAGGASILSGRARWGVRVLREPNWLRIRPLMYGEELVHREDGVRRALDIGRSLAAGRGP
jgi:hypothetical protein